MVRYYEDRRARRGYSVYGEIDKSVVLAIVSGHTEKSSGYGFNFYECVCQYVGA
jgi:hypothetical protein